MQTQFFQHTRQQIEEVTQPLLVRAVRKCQSVSTRKGIEKSLLTIEPRFRDLHD